LRDRLIARVLERLPEARLTGARGGGRLPHHASFVVPGVKADGVLLELDLRGIAASSGSACNALTGEPSHVLRAIGCDREALDVYDLRGKTDPRIVWDVLTAAGVPGEAIEARLGDCFEAYVRELETILGDGHAVELMPGIRELVGALSARPDAVVGLLTGNIEAGARLKLRPTGLLPHFRVGAYGSDHVDRRRLPSIAREPAAPLG